MAKTKYASVSIDLDSIACYQKIYGLAQTPQDARAYTLGLSRFLELMRKKNVKATLFAVAEDLDEPKNREILRAAADEGHEIASHTLRHDYRITKRPQDEIEKELAEAKSKLEDSLRVKVTGFRAPGYNVNEKLFRALQSTGHEYDSSLFPSLPYYLTRAAAIASIRLQRRRSHSLIGDARMMSAGRKPYLASPSAPWNKTDSNGIIELPIAVAPLPLGGLPALGSLFSLFGAKGSKLLYKTLSMSDAPLVVEFHALDFMSSVEDDLPEALSVQPDLNIPLEQKLSNYADVIDYIRRDYATLTLNGLARKFSEGEVA